MVFSSPVFLFLFLPITLLLVLPAGRLRMQNGLLLLASLLFYAWGEGVYLLLMLGTVLVVHLCGLLMGRSRSPRRLLVTGIVLNLSALAWFKYAGFLAQLISVPLEALGAPPVEVGPVHLPIGVSFFIFQGISYIVDVYRGDAVPQRGPANVALYISLFPQLIAGPIVRYRDVAAQLADRRVTVPLFASGVKRFVVGLAKKVLLADNVARIADAIFDLPADDVPFAVAWLGATAYAVQIYFDFSGYSDMAIGLGRLFGFSFLENFDRPYIARTIRDFWRRWHISLSTWFRDYLYIPLGGNRGSRFRTHLNLYIVFFLTGLWHGASWNFVVWGLIHGTFLVLERSAPGRLLERVPAPIAQVYTLFVVLVAWVFFRITDLTQAWHFTLGMLGLREGDPVRYFPSLFLARDTALALLIGVLGSLNLHARPVAALWPRTSGERVQEGLRGALEVAATAVLLILVAMKVSSTTYSPFIYFRF